MASECFREVTNDLEGVVRVCSLFADLPVILDDDGVNHHHSTKHGPVEACSGDIGGSQEDGG